MHNINRSNLGLGILGGMGTEASNYFQQVIVKKRKAQNDQQHMPMVCVTNLDIPDRTAHLLDGTKPNPLPEMLKSLNRLDKMGDIHFAVMPCNTAHAFRDELQKHSPIALLNMIKDTVDFVKENPKEHKVGLLATNGICQTGIYDQEFEKANIAFCKPKETDQHQYVHAAIYGDNEQRGIKGGEYSKSTHLLIKAIEKLIADEKIDSLILGCTELPLVREKLEEKFPEILFIDPMEVVAHHAIQIHDQAVEKSSHPQKINAKPVYELESSEDYANYIVARAYKQTFGTKS